MRRRHGVRVKVIRRGSRKGRPHVLRWYGLDGRLHEEAIPPQFRGNARLRTRYAERIERVLNGLEGRTASAFPFAEAVEAFLAARMAKGLKPSSIDTYRYILGLFQGIVRPRDLGAVRARDIERFLDQRSRPRQVPAAGGKTRIRAGAGAVTRRKEWVHLRAFFAWAVKTDRLVENPTIAVDAPRAPRPARFAFTETEAERLIEAARKEPVWIGASIRLAFGAGLRIGELAHLDATDVDWPNRRIRIPAQKSAEPRLVDFDEETGGLLHELRHRGPKMLWGGMGDPIVTEGTYRERLRAAVRRVCAAAGVPQPPKPLQDLRRTFATLLARSGINVFALQEVMGHQAIQTTRDFYIAPDAERAASEGQRRLRGALPWLVRPAPDYQMGDLAGDQSADAPPAGEDGGDSGDAPK